MKWGHSVVSDSLQPRGPARLLHPWDSPARILEWVAISFSKVPTFYPCFFGSYLFLFGESLSKIPALPAFSSTLNMKLTFWFSRIEPACFSLKGVSPAMPCHAMLSHFNHVWLFVTPWTVAHQTPLVHEILQARILVWVAISFSMVSTSYPQNSFF